MNIKTIVKIIVPVLILALAFGGFKYQMANKPEPKKKMKQRIIPIVRSIEAELVRDYSFQVGGYGTVKAGRQVDIVSEVAGKIIWVNKKLKTGGKFKKNEGLYRIDDTTYVTALDAKVATLKTKEYELQKIEEEAAISNREWEIWNDTGVAERKASPLVSYQPQLEAARAAVKSAQSAVASAKNDLAKILYKAPFNSIVTSESIEQGKVIRVGESAGKLVGTDRYEIYVPMAAKDAVKLTFADDEDDASSGYVELKEGLDSWRWSIHAERILPDADSKTGMLQAVLVVENPFVQDAKKPLLPIGVSIKAVVYSKAKQDLVRIPSSVVREGNVVWGLSHDNKVQIRDINIVNRQGGFTYVNSGLVGGEKLISSDLDGVVDGMTVNTGQMNNMSKGKSGGAQ
mgnify:CR=1 FL=1